MAGKAKKLTDYESQQAEEIAAWKAEFPNPFGELFHRLAQPVARAVEFLIPDRVALLAINGAYKASELAANDGDIKLQAGVDDISKLRHQRLEVCDSLAQRVGMVAQGVATVEGGLTGAGGIWTTLLDVPLLFTLCLRTIIKIGHCYGYTLDRPNDKAWVLAAFAIALSRTKQKRTDLLARLHEIEDLVVEQTQQQVVVEEAAALITQLEIFESIPVFAAATGALLNLQVAHKTEVTARRLFQERWLRDNAKVNAIAAAPDVGKLPSFDGWAGTLSRAGYSAVYGLSFSAALPVCMMAAMVRPSARPSAVKGPVPTSRNGEIKHLLPLRRDRSRLVSLRK